MEILKLNSKSVLSIDKEKTIDVELNNTYKNIIYTNVVEKLNARTLFEEERYNCDRYRLLFTIKPLCTNVLFNPFTEIVKYGDSELSIVMEGKDKGHIIKTIMMGNGYDKNKTSLQTTERCKLIQNTSNGDYEYQPGYDMFNNHILRSKTFKIVQNVKEKTKHYYNTLQDKMCDNKCKQINFFKRMWNGSNFTTQAIKKHLYQYDDVLLFNDGSAINEKLIEENGWFGFNNGCRIKTRDNKGENQDIERVIKNKNGGDFIDMYPDRTLFSFNPKQNKLLHRLEYNWHYVLTYPFANDKKHSFCRCEINGTESTGLKIAKITKTKTPQGSEVLMFKCYTKHGLQRWDKIRLIGTRETDKEGTKSNVINEDVVISSLGDVNGNDIEHCFLCTNMDVLYSIIRYIKNGGNEFDEYGGNITYSEEWMYDDKGRFKDSDITKEIDVITYMMNRMNNGVASEYYFRLFHKLPNFKFKKQKLTPTIAYDLDKYNNYLSVNCKYGEEDDKKDFEFTFENSKLGFAKSIYSDNLTQLVYTDDIEVGDLLDNLGRPLTEIYLTIIKNNKGYNIWYDRNSWTNGQVQKHKSELEYSHCFGKLTCGLEFGESSDVEANKYAKNGDVHFLNNIIDNTNTSLFESQSLCEEITQSGLNKKIKSNVSGQKECEESNGTNFENLFYGDFVEYNPNEAIEKVLEVCNYRFNTVLREDLQDENSLYGSIIGWDITYDDYDIENDNFTITQTDYNGEGYTYSIGGRNLKPSQKPEGYYYKPHYKIQLKEFGTLHQESHYDMVIRRAEPVQLNGIFISITTTLRHGCVMGDRVFICDDTNNSWYYTHVTYVVNHLTFYIGYPFQPYNNTVEGGISDWITASQRLNESKFRIRKENINIPRYAQRIDNNRFLWRDILHVGDNSAETLSDYPYANNAFYVNQDINFYLKRQDPLGKKGLFSGDIEESFPQDIKGVTTDLDNYEYKDETTIQC